MWIVPHKCWFVIEQPRRSSALQRILIPKWKFREISLSIFLGRDLIQNSLPYPHQLCFIYLFGQCWGWTLPSFLCPYIVLFFGGYHVSFVLIIIMFYSSCWYMFGFSSKSLSTRFSWARIFVAGEKIVSSLSTIILHLNNIVQVWNIYIDHVRTNYHNKWFFHIQYSNSYFIVIYIPK